MRAASKTGLILLVVAVLCILALPVLNLRHYWSHNPLYGYGWFTILMFAGLVYQRLDAPDTASGKPVPIATVLSLLCLLAILPLRIVQITNPDWRVLDFGIMGLAVAACLATLTLCGGLPLAKRMLFPLCFLAVGLPWPQQIENWVTLESLRSVAVVTEFFMSFLSVEVLVDGMEIATPYGTVHLNEACSGIRSYHLALVGGLFLGGYLKLGYAMRVVLVAGSFACGYIVNVARVSILVAIQYQTQSNESVEQWHDQVGLVVQGAFLVGMLAMTAAAFYFNKQFFVDDTTANAPTGNQTGELLNGINASAYQFRLPILSIAVLGVLIPFMAEGWFQWRGSSDPAEQSFCWTLGNASAIAGAKEVKMPLDIREKLYYDEGKNLVWQDEQGSYWQLFWLQFNGSTYSAFSHNIHEPRNCLPSQNFIAEAIHEPLQVELEGCGVVEWEHHVYRRDGVRLHLFFNKSANGSIQEPVGTGWNATGRIQNAILGYRIQSAQILHIMVVGDYTQEQASTRAKGYLQKILKGN